MHDMQRHQNTREKILSIIKEKGPSLPTRIAREINFQPLFVSAFLSELASDNRLKISNMKVGSSPLYYIEGQEPQLENFSEYLNSKEKEALNLLKQNKILKDEDQLPAIRVALRSIKDFATPITVRDTDTNQTKIFWKFFAVTDDDMKKIVSDIMLGKQKKAEKPQAPSEQDPQIARIVSTLQDQKSSMPEAIQPLNQKTKSKKQRKEKKADTQFRDSIVDYLSSKDIEILQEILVKKKEFISKIRLDTIFGKQEFYLISKEKSSITTDDLVLALQKAQSEKMPALFLATGKLHKNANEYLKEWRNFIKFERIII